MKIRTGAALLFLASMWAAIDGARADDTSECLKLSQPGIEAFNACAMPKVKVKAQGSEAPASIAEEVIGECQSRVDAMRTLLHKAPCSQSDEQTESVIRGWMEQARDDLSKAAVKFRGE
jgi:hypothetical protein